MSILATIGRMPRDLRLYTLGWGLVGFGYFGIFGVLFNLYLLRLGYGPETIGLLVGAGQVVWGLSAIPSGMVGERFSNRLAMIWGIGFTAVATILLLAAEALPPAWQTGWIATWWISSWVGSSLLIVNGVPYVMAVCAEEDRRDTFTIQQAAIGLWGFIGGLAAGVLPDLFSALTGIGLESPLPYWFALWLAPLAYLCTTLLLLRTRPLPPVKRERGVSSDNRIPAGLIVVVGLLVFMQTSGEGTIRAFFNVYLDRALDVPVTYIGVVMGVGQFLPALSSLAAPSVIGRLGGVNTIIVTGVTIALFMAVLALFANPLAASASYITILLTMAIAAIARSLFSQEIVAPEWRTLMSAAFTIGLAAGWAMAAGLGGYVIATFGYSTLFFAGAVMSALSGLMLWVYLRSRARPKQEAVGTLPSAP